MSEHRGLLTNPPPRMEMPLEQVSGVTEQATRISAGQSRVLDGLEYWRKQLAGLSEFHLSPDNPGGAIQRFRSATEPLVLPKNVSEALKALGGRAGVSIHVILLAALKTLLHRYTGEIDVLVWDVDRNHAQADSITSANPSNMGVPLRTDLSGDPSFREFCKRVQVGASEANAHGDVLPDFLMKEWQSISPPGVIFSFQQALTPWSGARISTLGRTGSEPVCEVDEATIAHKTEYELRFEIEDRPEGMVGRIDYNADLFDAERICRMAGHFGKLLEGIVENPDETVGKLPLLTDAERTRLVVEWNNTRMDYPRDRCVHHLFEEQAARTPNATAVVFGDDSLTYGELERRANQLANHLIRLGATPDSLVGICLERSLEMVVGLLGILKAGAAYVPLDPAYPRDRIAYMLENAEMPLLLTQAQLRESLPSTDCRTVLIDSDWLEIAKQRQERPALILNPENRAYVIYTSGSTGKPKGVEIPHRAVVNFLTTMAERPGMAASDRLLAVTTLSFDIAGLEIYLPLTRGACLEIVSREVSTDGHQLLEKLRGSNATVMQATPATWRILLEAGWTGDPRLKILIGGEAVSQKLANQLLQRAASVWNVYGPTETTIWSTLSKLEAEQSAVSIGRPIGNTEIFILDKMLQPVPILVAGELHIGGDGLARGYLKRPDLTAEKFIVHPLNPDPKARLYKTGDLVRYLPNGNIEFLGRIDHQVKIRGFRIELGEIETVLRQHPGINETVVVAREDTPGDKRVVAYFVPTGDTAPATAELRAFLKEKLPEYMLPSVFVTLKSMPLTPNGKIDRRALPIPGQADLTPTGTFAAPKDVVESRLAQIWESVLGVRPIGVRDDYFELGGHSLLAVKLMNRIEEAFGKNLPMATLLQAPTIEQLAAILRQKGSSPPWSCLVPIQRGGSKPPFFCVHGILGNVLRFYDLARHLGSDQPFFGLQPQGLDGRQSCHTRVEEMAAHYIKEIRTVQSEGPYFLGGYSFGGIVAFEMAQQLTAQNQEVGLLVLFDTFCAGPAHSDATEYSSKKVSLSLHRSLSGLLEILQTPVAQTWADLSQRAKVIRGGISWQVKYMRQPRAVKKIHTACERAVEHYVPKNYPGRVILFRSNLHPRTLVRDPYEGWHAYAGHGLEVRTIASDHDNILLEPQVRLVAEQLKTCLTTLQAAEPVVA
jgi:surfactin family lipopeptide synthetase A